MELELGQRLNLITGDNGLGKSFLLDVAWWALTQTWARHLVLPHLPPARAEIAYRYTKSTPGSYSYQSTFDRRTEHWSVKSSKPAIPGLVLYAQDDMTDGHGSRVQLIAATHSPLVLASAEPRFDTKSDAWFDLDLKARQVCLTNRPFTRLGEVGIWLVSDAFGLKEARSLEAEETISAALALARASSPEKEKIQRVDGLLRRALSDVDRFWVRWSEFKDSHGAGARRRKR